MTSIKTAISVEKSLFDQVDAVARDLKISRSRLFSLAVEEYIRRYENRRLLEAINAAYEDSPDAEEEMLLQKVRPKHKRLVEGEW
ncbi:MAG: hypothetical protein GXP42_10795 [Chloroflexi bacterium]|nr:hypothetical protein [Chloroflexota bacterium]